MKNIIKNTIISIGMSMAIFCIVGVVFDIVYGGNFSMENYQFTKSVVACVTIGLGFGVPSVAYKSDRLPMPIKVVIHMGIGLIVYTATAYFAGWFRPAVSLAQELGILTIQFAVAFIIWFGFMKYYSNEAREMNRKIQERKSN